MIAPSTGSSLDFDCWTYQWITGYMIETIKVLTKRQNNLLFRPYFKFSINDFYRVS